MSPGPLPPRYPCQQVPLNTKKPTPQQWEAPMEDRRHQGSSAARAHLDRAPAWEACARAWRAGLSAAQDAPACSVCGRGQAGGSVLSIAVLQAVNSMEGDGDCRSWFARLAGWLAGCQPGSKVSCALRCDAPLRADSRGCRLPPCKLNLPKQNLLQRASRDAR